MEASPYQSPSTLTSVARPANPQKVQRVAKYQKWILIALFGNAIMYTLVFGLYAAWSYAAANSAPEDIPPAYETLFGMLALIEPFLKIFSFIACFALARQFFGRPISWLVMIVGNLPAIGVLVMFLQNLQAARYLNRQGIDAGFFGTDLEKLHAQLATEDDE